MKVAEVMTKAEIADVLRRVPGAGLLRSGFIVPPEQMRRLLRAEEERDQLREQLALIRRNR